MSASTPHTIRKMPRIHWTKAGQTRIKIPATMAKIPMVAPLIVKVFFAIKLYLPQFGFTSHIIDFDIFCQQ
jgi:hypothetical protein